ncbi:Signal recognition particle protein [compost metagenome]
MRQIKKLGSLSTIFEMLPIGKMLGVDISKDQLAEGEKQLKRIETIIGSMTPKERRNPKLLDMSRKRRIASGSGTSVPEVNKLLKDFENMRQMMKQFGKFEKQIGKKMPKFPQGFGGGGFPFPPNKKH